VAHTSTASYGKITASPGYPEGISSEEMAKAGVVAFFNIAKEWGLDTDEARSLLGNPSRSRYYELKNAKAGACRGILSPLGFGLSTRIHAYRQAQGTGRCL